SYLDSYSRLEPEWLSAEQSWFQQLRQHALARFASLGFPGPKDENWKYTRVRALAETAFMPVISSPTLVSLNDCQKYFFAGMPSLRLAFIDGHFMPGLSEIEGLPQGAMIESLAEALKQQAGNLRGVLAHYAAYEKQPFTALNTAFITDGAYIYLPS